MISDDDVIMAYRLLFGRDPADEVVIRGHVLNCPTLEDLRTLLINSPEFRQISRFRLEQPGEPGVKTLGWPAQTVEVEVPPELLQRMIHRIEQEFLTLGLTEPHWSVLTADRFKAANIPLHEDEFYQSGAEPVQDLVVAADRCGVDLSRHGSWFELGCGVGRSTVWLGKQFGQVVGGDISAAHLEIARNAARRFGLKNTSFIHLNQLRLYQNLPAFDGFFSLIVLQHNPPPVMAFILKAILRQLAPGGIAYFQIPTYLADYEFTADSYLASEPPQGNVEVHCVPQPILFDLIERAGCRILELREDASLGANAISNRFLLRKPSASR